MANYEYKWNGKEGKVVEKSTGYILFFTRKKKQAIKLTNWLNAGGGFNGFTPTFFINKKLQETT